MRVKIVESPDTKKKYRAEFIENNKVIKTVRFGQQGASDFTKHRDESRKQRYLDRHRKRENWNDPMTAGALSRWILWNKPTITESIADFKRRFKLEK